MSDLSQLMLDHCPEMLLLVDPASLKIKVANATTASTLGYEPAALQGMAITEIESALQDVFYWEDVRQGQYLEVQDQEGQYLCADGNLLDVRKSIRLLAHQGTTLMLVRAVSTQSERIVEDVLAHTLSELRATLESTNNGILVIDWHGKVDSMNRLFGAMWGVPEELLNWQDDAKILNFICEAVVETDLLRERLTANMGSGETLDLLHHRDGRVFEASSRPQYLAEQIIGRVYGFQDITQRTRAEQALRESRDLLEQRVHERTTDLYALNEKLQLEKDNQAVLIQKLAEAQNQLLQSERMASIGQLAAGVAHEINNPVGFVNSNLSSLQRYVKDLLRTLDAYEQADGELSQASRERVSQLKEEVDLHFLRDDVNDLLVESLDGLKRVTRIVQDLKNFSHVDEPERQWADLESGLESTLRVAWNELKYKSEVVKEFSGIPQIECYPFQLNQVFMNLLVNAAQAIDQKGRITIRTGQDDDHVWVEIQDTGRGIHPEHVPRIFDPFFTTKPVGKGTGLGLSLAYGIVKKHDGRIEVHSEVGVGSTFRVTLPKNAHTTPADDPFPKSVAPLFNAPLQTP
jgi:PAS domain S-box-containing protein